MLLLLLLGQCARNFLGTRVRSIAYVDEVLHRKEEDTLRVAVLREHRKSESVHVVRSGAHETREQRYRGRAIDGQILDETARATLPEVFGAQRRRGAHAEGASAA